MAAMPQVPLGQSNLFLNPDRRCPCVLVLDNSYSMHGAKIDQLNNGFAVFQNDVSRDLVALKRLDIDVVERTVADHEPFGAAAFLGRTAIAPHAPGKFVGFEPILYGGRGKQCRRAEQVVPTAVAVAVSRQRSLFGRTRFLAETGQRVELTENGDYWPTFARLAHHRGRDARDIARDTETFGFEHGHVLGRRAVLLVAKLRHAPDAIA